VGPLGAAILVAAGVGGAVLAAHGYGRGALVAGPLRSLPQGQTSTTAAAPAPKKVPASTDHQPGGNPTTSTTTAPGGANPTPASGVLSSTPYAPYAYLLYPGVSNSQALAATAGFKISVTAASPGKITLSLVEPASGQPPQTATLPASDRVYFIETSFGDDSGDSDYNLGDDGVVITDAAGHIVQ
jgi:hypothetical protein